MMINWYCQLSVSIQSRILDSINSNFLVKTIDMLNRYYNRLEKISPLREKTALDLYKIAIKLAVSYLSSLTVKFKIHWIPQIC